MRARDVARPIAALVALAVAAAAPPAGAYYEDARVTGDDVRVIVEASGRARVEHHLVWRVVAGQPKGFDLVGTEPLAVPEPSVTLESEDGRSLAAAVTSQPGKGLHVALLEPRALRHGQRYHVTVACEVNLVDSHELVRDGTSYRLAWRGVTLPEGYDGPKVTFVLPAALEPPTVLLDDSAMRDGAVTTTLRRLPDHDEIELVRPHVARGEDLTWAVRVDARAFDGGERPALPPPPPLPRREARRGRGALSYHAVALLAASVAILVGWQERRARLVRGASVAPLVAIPSAERATTAGALLFVGVSLQLADTPAIGALAVSLAMLSAALRPRADAKTVRGPGRWLAVRPTEAFMTPVGAASSIDVAVPVLAAAAALGLAARVLAPGHPDAPRALGLDSLAIAPLAINAMLARRPLTGHPRAAEWLRSLYAGLRRVQDLRVTAWARWPQGRPLPDDLRLLLAPRDPLPGLVCIEIGLAQAWEGTSLAWAPELLIRTHEVTAAAARMTAIAPCAVPVPGRTAEERVFRLSPPVPTKAATRALAAALAAALIDRRSSAAAWDRDERRVAAKARAAETDATGHGSLPAAAPQLPA